MIKVLSALTVTLALWGCFYHHGNNLCHQYQGTLPAASSIGIETTLTFNDDGTFKEKSVYIGEKEGTFYQSGTYTLDNKRLTTQASDGEKNFYLLEKEQLRRLDMNGQPITGTLAEFYILKCH